jgi:hypothetical protein
MHTILLALGIVVTLAGGAMVGFGISNYGFEIGNALVTSGTTAVVGGLIIVALAALLRELRAGRAPERRAAPRPADAPPPEVTVAAGRDAAPEVPPPNAPSGAVADLAQVLAEPPVTAAPAPAPADPLPSVDPFAPPRADRRRDSLRDRGLDPVRMPEPPKADSIPARKAPDPPRESEPVAIRPPREPQAVTVLKSGVIEGMAYTLYSDGSIEADLPQGMARFVSIDALRRHLAGQG